MSGEGGGFMRGKGVASLIPLYLIYPIIRYDFFHFQRGSLIVRSDLYLKIGSHPPLSFF
uniref:Candidate secreted effector n=1 Tax=Meloidogyne incognita TaxID=6306 RepID=A0A914M0Y4_MELIC